MHPIANEPLSAEALSAGKNSGFRLAAGHDMEALSRQFQAQQRVKVPGFLADESAQRLQAGVAAWAEWALVTRIGGTHRVFDAAAMAALDHDKRLAFDDLVAIEARAGFQYLYERYPLYDRGSAGQLSDPLMLDAFALLRSEEFLSFARSITGDSSIQFADGQLTRYRRGHFLTLHDDQAEGLGRRAAFVLNLTPDWAADYGGQLQFVDGQGQVQEVVSPQQNLLTIFAVPAPHMVSAVAPFVASARYAITGWFRR